MKKLIFFLIILLHFPIYSQNLVYDDLTADASGRFSLTFHNLSRTEADRLQLYLNDLPVKDFKLETLVNQRLFGIIIDNSGSMKVADFRRILDRVIFLMENIEPSDRIVLWKLNNETVELSPVTAPAPEISLKVEKLIREGKLTRLYDGILSVNRVVSELQKKPEFQSYYPYLLVFSDGDDIGSANKPSALENTVLTVPFYFFSYHTAEQPKINPAISAVSGKSGGKVLDRPSREQIRELFIDRENRYRLSVILDLKKILKEKKAILTIRTEDQEASIDLKEFWKGNKDQILADNNQVIRNQLETTTTILKNSQSDTTGDSSADQTTLTTIRQDGSHDQIKLNFNGFSFPAWILPVLIGAGILLLLLILFFVIRRFMTGTAGIKTSGSSIGGKTGRNTGSRILSSGHQENSQKTGDLKNQNNQNNPSGIRKSDEKTSLKDGKIEKSENPDQKTSGRIETPEKKSNITPDDKARKDESVYFSGLETIEVREKSDLLEIRPYNKVILFNQEQTSEVVDRDHRGEYQAFDVDLTVSRISGNSLIFHTSTSMLLDEILEIRSIPFRIMKVLMKGNAGLYEITAVKEADHDLSLLFASKETLKVKRVTPVFGSTDAAMERLLNHDKPQGFQPSGFFKCDLVLLEKTSLVIRYHRPLILDTILEIRKNQELREFRVTGVEKKDEEIYENRITAYYQDESKL